MCLHINAYKHIKIALNSVGFDKSSRKDGKKELIKLLSPVVVKGTSQMLPHTREVSDMKRHFLNHSIRLGIGRAGALNKLEKFNDVEFWKPFYLRKVPVRLFPCKDVTLLVKFYACIYI